MDAPAANLIVFDDACCASPDDDDDDAYDRPTISSDATVDLLYPEGLVAL
jgi:hypothetical protein